MSGRLARPLNQSFESGLPRFTAERNLRRRRGRTLRRMGGLRRLGEPVVRRARWRNMGPHADTLPGRSPHAQPERTACRVGTAGWAIPRAVAEHFPSAGAGLERYSARFSAAEINSTFYRSHRASTYARWVAATPAPFRFAVKLPRTITHEARLVGAAPLVAAFRSEVLQLGAKLGPVLVQLPPTLAFDTAVAEAFFLDLRDQWPGTIVCEPRHPSWFEPDADALMAACRVARVAADPARHPAAAVPGGWSGAAYWRLHGSPRMYRSSYDEAALSGLASDVLGRPGETWCIFDNTASGAATANALTLLHLLRS